jgi:hypothetical protein
MLLREFGPRSRFQNSSDDKKIGVDLQLASVDAVGLSPQQPFPVKIHLGWLKRSHGIGANSNIAEADPENPNTLTSLCLKILLSRGVQGWGRLSSLPERIMKVFDGVRSD